MSLFPVAKKVGRPSILVFLAALALAWAGGSPAFAAEPPASPVTPDVETFLSSFSEADCAPPTGGAAELPELAPTGQPKSGSVLCSPYCGEAQCRGELMGEFCNTSTGPGTCYAPALGRRCTDNLPWCYCA